MTGIVIASSARRGWRIKRIIAALMMTTAIAAPAQADPVSISLAAATAAFSTGAAVTAAGIAGGLTFGAALSSLSFAVLATSAVLGGVLAGVSQALAGKPKKLGSGAPNAALRQPSPVLPLVYGETRIGGFARVYAAGENGSADRRNLYAVWVLAAREIDSILEIWDGDNLMWSAANGVEASYADRIAIMGVATGAPGQSLPAALVASLPTTLDAAGAAETNAHLDGLPYVAMRFTHVARLWANGLPSAMWFKVRGHRVHDPRAGLAVWTRNLALIAADYVRDAGGAAGDYLDDDNISAAANLCDEAVALTPSGTQARYTFDGAIATDAEPRENLIGLMAHSAGQAVWTGERLLLQPGAYSAPIIAFGSDDFVAPVRIAPETLIEDHIDGVAGIFTSAENGFNSTSYPQITLSDYDPLNGAARLLLLDLPNINDADRAQRVALLSLRQTRRLKRFGFAVPLTPENAALQAGDRVSVNLPAIGLTAVAQIVTRRSVYDPASPRVEIEALEDGATFWTWNADTATAAPVSVGSNFPNPSIVEPPVAPLTATASTRLAVDGTFTSTLLLAWGASGDPFLDDYEVTWVAGGRNRVARTLEPEYEIAGEAEGATLAIEVRAVNTLGVRSAPLTLGSVALVADTTPPPVPVLLLSAPVIGGVRFKFAPSAARDWAGWVSYERSIAVTVTPEPSASAPRWAVDDVTISGMVPGVTRRWWWRAIDRSGNQSAAVGPYDLTPRLLVNADISPGAVTMALLEPSIQDAISAGGFDIANAEAARDAAQAAQAAAELAAADAVADALAADGAAVTATAAAGTATTKAAEAAVDASNAATAAATAATARDAALASANASASSATSASTSATTATTQAAAATSAKTLAESARTQAQTSATASATSATAAGTSATNAGASATASQSSRLAADAAQSAAALSASVAAGAAATATDKAAEAGTLVDTAAKIGPGSNMIRNSVATAEPLTGWIGAISANTSGTFNGRFIRFDSGAREEVALPGNPFGRTYRVSGWFWNGHTSPLRVGIVDGTSNAQISPLVILRPAASDWAYVSMTVTGTVDAESFRFRFFCALPPDFAGIQSLIIEDITAAAEEASAAVQVETTARVNETEQLARFLVRTTLLSGGRRVISGFGFQSAITEGGTPESEFEILADKFKVVAPASVPGQPSKTMFAVQNVNGAPEVVVNGLLFADSIVTKRVIAPLAVGTTEIANNAVSRPYSATGSALNATVATVNMARNGYILAGYSRSFSAVGGSNARFLLKIDGVVVLDSLITGPQNVAQFAVRAVSSGSRVVRIEVQGGGIDEVGNYTAFAMGVYA